MPDNIPPSNQGTRWKNKWKRKKKSQVTLQNNNTTDTRQNVSELSVNGADFTSARSAANKTVFPPRVVSYRVSEGSSLRSTAGVTQLQQRDEASPAVHRTVPKLDNNPLSNNSTRWKKKRKKKNKQQATAETNNNKSLFNAADFTLGRTIVFHPRISSDSDVSSESTAVVRQSQGSTSSTTTSTHISPLFSALVRPPHRPADSKTHFSSAVAGPSSRPSGSQRPVGSFSPTGVPSKYLAIDCEMVGTGPKGSISQLARCSIVSYDGDVVYDKFIRPPVPITDYRTRWSGIRARDLHGATPYAEARKEILKLLKGKVLIGHAIHNDLKALNYCLAKDFIRDTSRIPLLNIKAGFNEKEVVSLKRLTKALFNTDIQTGRTGHSSVEDAKATMDLYKLAEVDWERTLASTAKNCQTENE